VYIFDSSIKRNAMTTKTLQLLQNVYGNLLESSKKDGDVAIARRDLWLAIQQIQKRPHVDFFQNEKGDITITLNEAPIAICGTEAEAKKLKAMNA
jgi:hypothetical protein